MILSYLYSMGFSVVLTYRVNQHCFNNWNGCFIVSSKTIVISGNTLDTFWHEVGHALTYDDKELYDLAKSLDGVKGYQKRFGKNIGVHEFMAVIFAKYKSNPEYVKNNYIELYNYFKSKKYFNM